MSNKAVKGNPKPLPSGSSAVLAAPPLEWRVPLRRLLLAAAGSGFVFLLGRDALPALLRRVLVRGDQVPVAMMTRLDAFPHEAVPDGNLFLRFQGFVDTASPRPGQMSGLDAASLIYFRTVYALYPQRVYTGPEERRITRGTEFVVAPFAPDAAWLRARGVRRVLTFTRDDQGNIYQDIRPVPGGVGLHATFINIRI